MRPFLSGGATVGIAPIVQPPEVGSVVLCKFENRVLLHRVQEVHRDPSGGSVLAVTVRGDAETPGDEDASQRVPAKDVLGVLTDAHAAAESALQRIRTWLKRLAR
ncbi:MAG: hypothetical protein ACKVPX_12710 [Myxococcaceae bacterium]